LVSWLARTFIDLGQWTPFAGRGGYSEQSLATRGRQAEFPQAEQEASRAKDFHAFFGDDLVSTALQGRDVLDFGSGYGGRTVEYARSGARFVWGIEPFDSMVSRSIAYARHAGVANVDFKLCGQDTIPLPDAAVDVVVSYDVLEHVDDPRISMREIHRVLKPGGRALLVFPVYFGAFSHHLDYITLLPGLHWLFPPDKLVSAVNELLRRDSKQEIEQQPQPRRSFDGARYVLPTLNGLGGEHLRELLKDFTVVRVHRHGLFRRHRPRSRTMRLLSSLPNRPLDMITSSVSCVLEKP